MNDITPHWDAHNPWRDNLFYVPLKDLAECSMTIGKPIQLYGGTVITDSVEAILKRWFQYGTKLDAYVLTGKTITGGVRYGPEGHQYLSPGFSLPRLYELIRQEQQRRRKSA